MSDTKEQAIIEQIAELTPEEQQRVLQATQRLVGKLPPGTPGRDLLRFAGTISKEDAEEMRQAIEEGCERIEPGEW